MASIPGEATVVLRGGRLRWVLVCVASAVFTAGGVLIFLVAPGGRVGGVVVFVFFGFCALAAGVQLVTGSLLVLTPEGFAVTSFGRRVARRWDAVGPFYVIRPTLMVQMVAFTPAGGLGMGALPDTYGMKAEALVALMNEWRARHGGRV